jgi:hypothetical protein
MRIWEIDYESMLGKISRKMAALTARGLQPAVVEIELTSYARALIHALQSRKPGDGPVNWPVLAKNLNLTVDQLKVLAKVLSPRQFELGLP